MALTLLALASLFWAGNWVVGRMLRDAFEPVTLNFLRWSGAAVVLAPFAWRGALESRAAIRRSAGVLALLALTGVALFQSLIYLGLRRPARSTRCCSIRLRRCSCSCAPG